MPIESERKYLNADLPAISSLLSKMSAISSDPYFEINIIFDANGYKLVRQKKLLRLRAKIWPHKTEYLLTFKLPADSLIKTQNTPVSSPLSVKVREELEVNVSDFKTCINILNNLGYREISRYEKVRESWTLKNNSNLHVDLDHLPFCKVAEIEGQPGEIDSLAIELNLDKMKISTKSYYELYQDCFLGRKNKGIPLKMHKYNIVFNPDEKAALIEKYNFPNCILTQFI